MDSRQSVGTQGEDAVAPPLDVEPPSISGDSPPVIPSSASARAMACDLVVASVARACMDAVKVHHARWIEKMGGRNVGDFSGGFTLARCACVNKLWRKQFDGLWDGPTCPSRDWAVRHVLEHVRDALEMHTMMDESDDEDEWKTLLKDDPWRDADPGLVLGVEASYRELRVSVCAGRRFYHNPRDINEVNSQPLGEILPADAPTHEMFLREAAPTAVGFQAQCDDYPRGPNFKYVLGERFAELDRLLEARGSALGGALVLQCSGGMSFAGDDVLVGVRVGDVARMVAKEDFADDDVEAEFGSGRDAVVQVSDKHAALYCRAPKYFVGALRATLAATFKDLCLVAGTPAPGAKPLALLVLGAPPVYFVHGQAGGQQSLRYLMKKHRGAEEEDDDDDEQNTVVDDDDDDDNDDDDDDGSSPENIFAHAPIPPPERFPRHHGHAPGAAAAAPSQEPENTFARASQEVLATRRIVRGRRSSAPAATPSQEPENTFARAPQEVLATRRIVRGRRPDAPGAAPREPPRGPVSAWLTMNTPEGSVTYQIDTARNDHLTPLSLNDGDMPSTDEPHTLATYVRTSLAPDEYTNTFIAPCGGCFDNKEVYECDGCHGLYCADCLAKFAIESDECGAGGVYDPEEKKTTREWSASTGCIACPFCTHPYD